MEQEKVIFDTDIGTDIDDAVALAYLLSQPRCTLLGVTTVSGQPLKRAELASAICRNVGRDDVPIHPGASVSILVPYHSHQEVAQQSAALGDWPRRTEFAPASAIEFLRQTIRAHPHEVTLLATGPMTNIGLLFAVDPEIPALLKRLVLMGGAFFQYPVGESNIRNDVHAAALVYGQGPQQRPTKHVSYGLDVTRQCTLLPDECRRRFMAEVLRPVRDFAEVWFAKRPRLTFHDPLAAAGIFQPDLCQYRAGRVRVAVLEPTLGWTAFSASETDRPHEVAETVDAKRFFEHYFDVVK